MPVTINVNRLSLVHERSGGVSSATLPNVCATPDAGLVAYPSTALSRDLASGSRDVVADGGNSIAVRGARFAVSSGDEPGTLGGVVSRVHGAESSFLSWSLDVKIEGRNACRLTDKMLHNAANTLNCSGVIQSTLREHGAVVDVLAKDHAHHGKYSLRVTVNQEVVEQPPAPSPHTVKKLVPIPDARVRIRAGGDVSRQGHTVSKPGAATHGSCLFDHLARGKYGIELYHDCFAEDARPRSESVHADPTKSLRTMSFVHLREIANERGVVIGVRADVGKGNPLEDKTAALEYNDLVLGSFLSSRSGDSVTNRALTDLSGDHRASLEVSYEYVQSVLDFAAANGMQVMVTPLVWPAPLVTPGWPAGHPATKAGTDGYIAPKDSYVARRLVAENKPAGDAAAQQKAAMEVHEAYIRRVMEFFRDRKVTRAGIADASPVPSYVVVNECLNLRYHGAQDNATPDRDFARDHPFFRLFGLWDVEETRHNLVTNVEDSFRDAIKDKTLWKHIARCFEVAHEVDPDALLILNDYGMEGIQARFDFWHTKIKRDTADAATRKARDARLSGPPRKQGKKVVESADGKRDARLKRAKEKRKKSLETELPKAVDPATKQYRDAVETAAAAFDNTRDKLQQDHLVAVHKLADTSRGIHAFEKDYKKALPKLEVAYKGKLPPVETAYTQALANAATAFTAAYAAANAPVPPASQKAHDQILAVAVKHHTAAQAYHRAIRALHKQHNLECHRIWYAYQTDYSKKVRPHAQAYDRAEKPQLFYRLVEWLLKSKAPWTKKLVVGYQMHYPAYPEKKGYQPENIARAVRLYAKLKLPVVVTEIDLTHEGFDATTKGLKNRSDAHAKPQIEALKASFKAKPDETPEAKSSREWQQNQDVLALADKLAEEYHRDHRAKFLAVFRSQAERTRKLVEACLSARNCLGITTWNIADYRSAFRYFGYWFRPDFQCSIPGCTATHPEGEYDRKPSYHAAASAFLRSPKQFNDAEIRQGKAKRYVETRERGTKKAKKTRKK